jgi:hypothetical protein
MLLGQKPIACKTNMFSDKSEGSVLFPKHRSEILKWFVSISLLQKTLIVIFSIFFASPIGVNHYLVYKGLFIGDPILLLFLGVAWLLNKPFRNICNYLISGKKIIMYFLFFFLFFEGLIFTHLDIISVYTDFRCAVIIFVFYTLCNSENDKIRKNSIYLVTIIIVISFAAMALFFVIYTGDSLVKKYYSPFGIIILAIVSYYEKNPIFLFFSLTVSLYISATSFYRALMFFPVIFLLIFFIRIMRAIFFKQGEAIVSKVLLIVFLFVLILSAGPVFNAIMNNLHSNPFAFDQAITKTLNALQFFKGAEAGQGDELRLKYITFIMDNFPAFLIPSGFGHDAIINHWGPLWTDNTLDRIGANSMDGMHLYFACHFGLILSFIAFVYMSWKLITSFLLERGAFLLIKFLLIIFFVLNLFAAAFPFGIISNSIFFGAVTGMLMYVPKKPQSFSVIKRPSNFFKEIKK